MKPDRRIKGRPLTDLLDTASELEKLEQQKREIDARLHDLRNSQGDLLRSARVDAGVSVRGLAASLGKSASYVSQVENGIRGASSDTVMAFVSTISATSAPAPFVVNVNGTPIQEASDGNEDSSEEEGHKGSGT